MLNSTIPKHHEMKSSTRGLMDAYKEIGYSPAHQANLLEMLPLDPELLKITNELPLRTKTLLANSKELRKKKTKAFRK